MVKLLVIPHMVKFQNVVICRHICRSMSIETQLIHQKSSLSSIVSGSKYANSLGMLKTNIRYTCYFAHTNSNILQTSPRKIYRRSIHLSSPCTNKPDFKKMKEQDGKRMKRLILFISTCFILWMGGIGLHVLLLPSQVFGYDELAFLPSLIPWADFAEKLLPTGEVEKIVLETDTAYAHVYTKTGLRVFKLDIDLSDPVVNVEKMLRDEEQELNIHPMHGIPVEHR